MKRRNWTIAAHTENTITFGLYDEDGEQGFPGDVRSYVTYTVTGWEWDIRISAVATTERTPIMMTSHVRSSYLYRESCSQLPGILELGWFQEPRYTTYKQPHSSHAICWSESWD